MTQSDLEDQLTLFAADILASPLALPGSDEAIKMTDTSGRKCLRLSKLSGPAGSLEKTLLATSLWASTRCYLTWKAQATPAGATLYRLSPQMPRTDAIESGSLLHTPTAKANQMSPDMVRKGSGWATPAMWATPTAAISQGSSAGNPNREKAGKDLRQDVRMWPTPTANEDAAGTPNGKMQRQLGNHPDIRGNTPEEWKRGSLNPAWVEWLMGYPVGYTDLNN